MKKSIKMNVNVYTLNLDKALEDFKKLSQLSVDVSLTTNTWGKHCYNLSISDTNYNHVLRELIEEIIWHDDYVSDTDDL